MGATQSISLLYRNVPLDKKVLGCSRFLANRSQLHVMQVGWKFMQVLCVTEDLPMLPWFRTE